MAQFVEIDAEIELLSHRSEQTNNATAAKPMTISVRCITGSNGWRIEDDWSVNAINKWLFDGTNVYQSVQIVRPLPPEMEDKMSKVFGLGIVPSEESRSNLTINIWPSPDGHPLGDEDVNIPWLAFCSGTYLKRPGRQIPLVCEPFHHTPDRCAYTDQTDTFGDPPGLPRSVDLHFSGARYLSSVEDFYKGWGSRYVKWVKLAVTNLQEGALIFHYSVTATTNFMGWTFPLRFEFYQKGRPFLQNEGWEKRGIGTLKSIRAGAAPGNLFDPNLQQTIVDRRVTDEATGLNENIYRWTGASVPHTEDPALQDKFIKRVERARRHKDGDKRMSHLPAKVKGSCRICLKRSCCSDVAAGFPGGNAAGSLYRYEKVSA